MIIRELNAVENKELKHAIDILSKMHNGNRYHFQYLYIDPVGGCDIQFEGVISEPDIAKFFELLGDENSLEYNYDFTYRNNSTSIFTKDGWKY